MYSGALTVKRETCLAIQPQARHAGVWPMFLDPIGVFATTYIPFEVAKMRKQFDEAFDTCVRRVRRWICFRTCTSSQQPKRHYLLFRGQPRIALRIGLQQCQALAGEIAGVRGPM